MQMAAVTADLKRNLFLFHFLFLIPHF